MAEVGKTTISNLTNFITMMVVNNIILTIAFMAVAIICAGASTIAYLGGALDGNIGGVDNKAARGFSFCTFTAVMGIIGAWTSDQYSVLYWVLFLAQILGMTFLYQKACKT